MNNLRTVLHSNACAGFRTYGVVSGKGLSIAGDVYRIFSVNPGKRLEDQDLPYRPGMEFYLYPTGAVVGVFKDRFDGLLHVRTYRSLGRLKAYGPDAEDFDVPCAEEDWELAEYLKSEFRLSPDDTATVLAGLYLYETARTAANL